jgi:hypothetical protein
VSWRVEVLCADISYSCWKIAAPEPTANSKTTGLARPITAPLAED